MNKQEILQYSYWEHYKLAKDLSFVLPLNHPRRVRIEKEINLIQLQLKELETTKPEKG